MRWLPFVMIALAGCGPVDLIVVDVPDASVFTPDLGPVCANTSECIAGQLCEKAACGDPLGHCVARPTFCDGETRPECGCDGITYWNDCLRRSEGIESRIGIGPCLNPRPCDTTTPCPDGAYCARLIFPDECGRIAAGACYVIPDTCMGLQRDHFFSCDDPGLTQCLSACEAIRSGQPAMRFRSPCG